jgi:hypothetical protein
MGRSQIFLLWLPLFIIQFFNPILEGYLFTTAISEMDQLIGAFIFGAIISLVYAVTGAYLFPAAGAEISIRSSLNEFFGSRTKRQNILRFLIASLSWALIYFIFGSIVGPFVLPYYTDPSSGYNLILPDVVTLLLIQIFRGFVYVLSVLPLLASLRLDFRMVSFILMAFLYIGGGIAIFVIIETFPVFLRIVHGVEIFADSLVFGIVIAYLLGSKSE